MFLSKLESISNAQKLVSDNQILSEVEEVPLFEAHKRVLAEDIMAFHDSPPFDKSAMATLLTLLSPLLKEFSPVSP